VIVGHHGLGEEVLVPALAAGGSLVSLVVVGTRVKLAELRRWIRRR
jgi:hypothetical protein